jgi:hypothetical protein
MQASNSWYVQLRICFGLLRKNPGFVSGENKKFMPIGSLKSGICGLRFVFKHQASDFLPQKKAAPRGAASYHH